MCVDCWSGLTAMRRAPLSALSREHLMRVAKIEIALIFLQLLGIVISFGFIPFLTMRLVSVTLSLVVTILILWLSQELQSLSSHSHSLNSALYSSSPIPSPPPLMWCVTRLEQLMTASLLSVLLLYLFDIQSIITCLSIGDPWAPFEILSLFCQAFALSVLLTIRERLRDGDVSVASTRRPLRRPVPVSRRRTLSSLPQRLIRSITTTSATPAEELSESQSAEELEWEKQLQATAQQIHPEGSYRYAYGEIPNPMHDPEIV